MTVTVHTMSGVVTPWVTYTPTFTGFGTAASISVWSRRVADTLQIRGKFTSGTSTGTEARITLGFNGTDGNVTSSATKVPSIQQAGTMIVGANGAFSLYTLIESNIGYLTIGVQASGSNGLTKALGNAIASSGNVVTFLAEIPISGW